MDRFLKRCWRYSFEALSGSDVHSYIGDYGGCKEVQNLGLHRTASLSTEKQWEMLEEAQHFRKAFTVKTEAEL